MPEIKLSELNQLVGGELTGNPESIIKGVAKIDESIEGDISFIYQQKYEKCIETTKATAVIVKKNFSPDTNVNLIKVDDPYFAFIKIIEKYFMPPSQQPDVFNPKQEQVLFNYGKNFRKGENVSIGNNTIIGDNVTIHPNSVVFNNVEIGDGTVIYPNVTIREGCKIGKRNILHPGAVIGSDGFGYQKLKDRSYYKVPQVGIVILEDDVEIGANTTIDRATVGATIIRRGSKIDNLVQIAHNCEIGEDCAISGQVGLSGTTKLGNRVVVAGQVGFAGHITIGDDAVVLAKAGVDKDLKPGKMYLGAPAKERSETLKFWATLNQVPEIIEDYKKFKNEIEQYKKLLSKFNTAE